MKKENETIATKDKRNELVLTTKEELIGLVKEMTLLNISTLVDKMNEIESHLEDKIDKMVNKSYCKSAMSIINEVKRQEQLEREKIYDRRLRNAKYLFRNYNNLVNHYKNAVYLESELTEDESLTEIYDFIDEENESLMIQSIYRSKRRTEIMITHIKVCIDTFIQECYNS